MTFRMNLLRVAILVGVSTLASADTILLPQPDIMSSFLSVSYNSLSGVFSADGSADSFTVLNAGFPTLYGISSGSFALVAVIANGGAATSGTLTINGCILQMPGAPGCSSSSLLLSGNLRSFGFMPFPDGELDFGFYFLTGELAPLYRGHAHAKMNLSGFPGSFESSFETSDFSNVADVGVPTPEPGTSWLLLAAGAVLSCKQLRKRRTA